MIEKTDIDKVWIWLEAPRTITEETGPIIMEPPSEGRIKVGDGHNSVKYILWWEGKMFTSGLAMHICGWWQTGISKKTPGEMTMLANEPLGFTSWFISINISNTKSFDLQPPKSNGLIPEFKGVYKK